MSNVIENGAEINTFGDEIWRAALAYSLGDCLAIFPIVENAKRPAVAHGFKDATSDLKKIGEWFDPEKSVTYNIAASPDDHGCFVVDVDVKNNGIASWEQFKRDYSFTEEDCGFIVATPSGGRHYWFRGEMPRNSAGKY